MAKISVLGAGSGTFALNMIRDFCLTPNLHGSQICFMDIDQKRLDASHSMCVRLAKEFGCDLHITKTTSREEALTGALDQMQEMRAREGESLKADVLDRICRLEKMTGQIEERYPATVEEYRQKLRARVEELMDGTAMDEQRLIQEVAVMADRSAIAEETVRLHSHFAQVREMAEDKEPVGRKLDFIVQELNREVNTISSKSQDVPITNLVVSAKAEIEKIREQVQNIE